MGVITTGEADPLVGVGEITAKPPEANDMCEHSTHTHRLPRQNQRRSTPYYKNPYGPDSVTVDHTYLKNIYFNSIETPNITM